MEKESKGDPGMNFAHRWAKMGPTFRRRLVVYLSLVIMELVRAGRTPF